MDSTDAPDFTILTSHAFSFSHLETAETIFSAIELQTPDNDDLAGHLLSRINQVEALGESLVSIIQLNKYTPSVMTTLENAFYELPRDLFENVVYNSSTGQCLSMIPRARKNSSDIRFLINYPWSSPDNPASIRFLPLGVWICPPRAVRNSTGQKPMVSIICTEPDVPKLLASHFADTRYRTRWERLQKQPLWIFADLLHVFGDWSQVWNITKQNLTVYHHEILTYPLTRPLLELTQGLHVETARILSVREQLRVHSSALTRFLRLKDVKDAPELVERVQEHSDDINYHEETSQVILRQLENLMSLAFNIETMTQGQAVARLNVLAFALLPLSWVASIFGMTQFSISPVWYPLWAFVALLAIILVSFALPVRGIYDYVLGLSTPRRLHGKAFLSVLKAKKNNSPSAVPDVAPETGLLLPWTDGPNRYASQTSPPFLVNRIGGAVQPTPPPAAALRRSFSSLPNPAQGVGHSLLRYMPMLAYLDPSMNTLAARVGVPVELARGGGARRVFELDASQPSGRDGSMEKPPSIIEEGEHEDEKSVDLEAQRSRS